MKSYLKTLLILFSIIIFSCGQKKKEPENEKLETRYTKQQKLDTLNKNESNNLSVRWNAIADWSRVPIFTYQLQEKLNSGSKPISFIGHINDIVRKDTSFLLKIVSADGRSAISSNKAYFAEISVSSDKFQELSRQLVDTQHSRQGCFIFKCNKISSGSKLIVDSEVSGSEAGDDLESFLTYNYNEIFVLLKGELIDFYLYKRLGKG